MGSQRDGSAGKIAVNVEHARYDLRTMTESSVTSNHPTVWIDCPVFSSWTDVHRKAAVS